MLILGCVRLYDVRDLRDISVIVVVGISERHNLSDDHQCIGCRRHHIRYQGVQLIGGGRWVRVAGHVIGPDVKKHDVRRRAEGFARRNITGDTRHTDAVVTLVIFGKGLERHGAGAVAERPDKRDILIRCDDQLEERCAVPTVVAGVEAMRDGVAERQNDAGAGLARVECSAAAAAATC